MARARKRIIPFSTPQQAQNWIEKYVIILRRLWEHGAKVVNCGNLINSLQSLLRLTYQQHHWGCSSTQSIYIQIALFSNIQIQDIWGCSSTQSKYSNCTVVKYSNSSTRYLRVQEAPEYSDCTVVKQSNLKQYNTIQPESGWQKLCEGTKGLHRKVWIRTKILSPNICYFIAILRFVAVCTLFESLWEKNCLFRSKTVFLG